ncbi:MAG: tRNA (cytidine(56)-2'-O)-methyltransferase [Candidatus Micrarchaeota archaeon]
MDIWVLRYGHRKVRDNRASAHVALVARAFGAKGIIFSGEKDEELVGRIKKVVREWGGEFEVGYEEDWKKIMTRFRQEGACFVHLIMYGVPIEQEIRKIRGKGKKCLVLVGSQKVRPEVYKMADFNISITNQPHSEIAALAIFLDRCYEGKELKKAGVGRVCGS